MDDDAPFVATAELVVRGGGLSLPWVVQTKSIEDRVFITLKQTCAAFARGMGAVVESAALVSVRGSSVARSVGSGSPTQARQRAVV